MDEELLRRVTDAIERKLRNEWDYIDLGGLHDEGGWQKLAQDAAAAAIEVLAPNAAA